MDKTALEAAEVAYRDALELARREPTPEHRDAVKAAWAAREAISPPMKRGGYSSRAGRRQRAELVASTHRAR